MRLTHPLKPVGAPPSGRHDHMVGLQDEFLLCAGFVADDRAGADLVRDQHILADVVEINLHPMLQ